MNIKKKLLLYKSQKDKDEKEINNLRNLLKKVKEEKPQTLTPEEINALKNLDKNDLNKNLLEYLDGAEKLEKAVRRINHKDPLNALGEKIDKENLKNLLRNLLKLKKL